MKDAVCLQSVSDGSRSDFDLEFDETSGLVKKKLSRAWTFALEFQALSDAGSGLMAALRAVLPNFKDCQRVGNALTFSDGSRVTLMHVGSRYSYVVVGRA